MSYIQRKKEVEYSRNTNKKKFILLLQTISLNHLTTKNIFFFLILPLNY